LSDQPPTTRTTTRTIAELIAVMAALREPDTGCPWDLEQDFSTIAPYTIEEAYEVADAIERGDLVDLKDELGDLLLQVVYHSRLAEEQGAFAFPDVVGAIVDKMVRRHPHVFGDEQARTAGMAKGAWERIKAEEKAAKAAAKAAERARASSTAAGVAPRTGDRDEPRTPSLLDDVPVGMPALTRAVKLQDKAARVGFDWPSLAPVLDKMKEELAELEAALSGGGAPASDAAARATAHDDRLAGTGPAPTAAIEEEFGDLLFVMANVARHLQLDPEAALRRANDKFRRRFAYIEAELARRSKTPAQSSLDEMDAIWNEVRALDKG
jgi:ATP diphosphatase